MLNWKFYISGIEVEEPQGWDGVEFTLKRSANYTGLENVYTPTLLTFDSVGARLITDSFNKDGFDGSLPFVIEQLCDNSVTYKSNWSINLFTYKKINNEVTVQVEESGFQRKFKNRSSIVVSLEDTNDQDGEFIGEITQNILNLHSKSIDYIDSAELYESQSIDYGIYQLEPDKDIRVSFIYSEVLTELKGITPMSELLFIAGSLDTPPPIFIAPFASEFVFEFNFDLFSFFSEFGGTLTMDATALLYVNGVAHLLPNIETQFFGVSTEFGFRIRSTESMSFQLNKGDAVGFNVRFFNIVSNDDYQARVVIEYASFNFVAKTSSLFPASTAKTYTIFNAFERIVTLITGSKNSFKSDFFSQNQDAGCGAFTNLTNGKNIRNMLQKDGTKYPVSLSFDDLFKSADAIWCLGYRLEYDGYGRGSIRVEPKSYFFKNQPTKILDNASDIEYSVAHDKIFNEITIGYEKWNLNTGRVNGIDEFNTVHNYSLPIINAKNKINAVSKAIASGYCIEITRRIQYNDSPTTDFETDDDIFFIATNPFEVNSNKYTLDGSSATYAVGTVSERDENFEAVENLLSPETAYNIRLSPKRNLARWWGYIAPSLFWKIKENANVEIKFNSGQGNVLERDLMTGYCDDFGGYPCRQNEGLRQSNLLNGKLLFIPTKAIFEYPITMNTFSEIRKDADKTIQFSCGIEALSGFIEEVVFKPNSENGTSDFTLLLAPDGSGAFDEGFDNGFDI